MGVLISGSVGNYMVTGVSPEQYIEFNRHKGGIRERSHDMTTNGNYGRVQSRNAKQQGKA